MKQTSAPTDILEKQTLALVENRAEKFTPAELITVLSRSFELKKKAAGELIRSLVTKGHLTYTDCHGRTVIDISFNRPVQVSPRIMLIPEDIPFTPEPGMTGVRLLHGASFGDGHHPTTRLSLQAVDHVLHEKHIICEQNKNAVLDIGTGSGVLAIAALKLGMNTGIGIDIDPCAISEARENARINGLENRLQISGNSLENFPDQSFSLITANLRLPTLNQIFPRILRLAEQNCGLVLSGIHSDEISPLLYTYTQQGFSCLWQKEEKDWAALGLFRQNAA